jgi:hypothetical protein
VSRPHKLTGSCDEGAGRVSAPAENARQRKQRLDVSLRSQHALQRRFDDRLAAVDHRDPLGKVGMERDIRRRRTPADGLTFAVVDSNVPRIGIDDVPLRNLRSLEPMILPNGAGQCPTRRRMKTLQRPGLKGGSFALRAR